MTSISPELWIVAVALKVWCLLGAVLFRIYLGSRWVARPWLERALVLTCGPWPWWLLLRYRLRKKQHDALQQEEGNTPPT